MKRTRGVSWKKWQDFLVNANATAIGGIHADSNYTARISGKRTLVKVSRRDVDASLAHNGGGTDDRLDVKFGRGGSDNTLGYRHDSIDEFKLS